MPITDGQPFDLAAILEPRGLKESDLAQVLSVSERTVLFWRTGERKPSIHHAREAERLLGIPRHELRPDLWQPPAKPRAKQRQFRATGDFQITAKEAAAVR